MEIHTAYSLAHLIAQETTRYNPYTYASGPYELRSSQTVSSVYIYTPVSGNVKLAIYSSRNYKINGWVGPMSTQINLLFKVSLKLVQRIHEFSQFPSSNLKAGLTL